MFENYRHIASEPGAAYHNGRYMLQLLYLAQSGKAGISVAGKARP
jgi:hypothetical protein